MIDNVEHLNEVTDNLTRCDMCVRTDPSKLDADEVREIALCDNLCISLELCMDGGELFDEHEHLLMRKRREPYHGREQVTVLPCKSPLGEP